MAADSAVVYVATNPAEVYAQQLRKALSMFPAHVPESVRALMRAEARWADGECRRRKEADDALAKAVHRRIAALDGAMALALGQAAGFGEVDGV